MRLMIRIGGQQVQQTLLILYQSLLNRLKCSAPILANYEETNTGTNA